VTWRELATPQPVVAFIADLWMNVTVNVFDDESREVTAFAPAQWAHAIILDRSRYRPPGRPGPAKNAPVFALGAA
jgi:hypothetical protein